MESDECRSYLTYARFKLNYSPNWILMFAEKAENWKNFVVLAYMFWLVSRSEITHVLDFN